MSKQYWVKKILGPEKMLGKKLLVKKFLLDFFFGKINFCLWNFFFVQIKSQKKSKTLKFIELYEA